MLLQVKQTHTRQVEKKLYLTMAGFTYKYVVLYKYFFAEMPHTKNICKECNKRFLMML